MQTSLPLSGVRVFDLTRILAGPTCTQLLGDLGADIIKVEKPFVGDDTRTWGPPYVKDRLGNDTTESAYYLSANRNKRSVTIDLSQPAGIELAKSVGNPVGFLIFSKLVSTANTSNPESDNKLHIFNGAS